MFETHKVRKQDKFSKYWSQHLNTRKPQKGTGPGVRMSKHHLMACHARSMFFENLPQLKRVKNWCNVWSMEGVTIYGHHPECRVTFRIWGLILFDKIPVPTIELPYRRFLYISLPVKLTEMTHRPQNKTFIRGTSPGVSDELWDKNAVGGQRWDVAAQ